MLNKHHDFTTIEKKHYSLWEKENAFSPNMQAQEAFAIMMPPPNVTGTLHLGHALDNTLPDILVRYARMQGKAALYQPGTDHASIAVHVVLEREWAKEGKSRFDFGRETFLKKAWEWKEFSQGTIQTQLRRLGISCDWGNERFTMDERYSRAVEKVFVDLYNRGLIYRGQRLVNWDPNMQTAVSDLEVKHKEIQGKLWHFKYPYVGDFTYKDEKTGVHDGIVIATTRPETILADGAIAVNPEDPRAKDLIGQYVTVPIVERRIPIIADGYVDPEFGSGMVKITAAHDFNDFEVYKRHKEEWDIPLINLMTPDAKMNDNCPPDYVGLDRFDARRKVIKDFKALGLFVKEESHTHNVGHAERDDTVLEPYLTNQWYVKGKPLAEKILQKIDDEGVAFVNDRDERVMRHWLENIEDWCVSRQLWWGHQVPAWFRGEETYVGEKPPEGEGWTRDSDILDTWFSSALWPFVTQGWPEQTPRVKKFYPGQVIMTGRDILFFWDVRMLMMSLELTEEVPFRTIYTHGLILDEHGQKMSKSKGNVVNPMDLLDTYGADALRLTMAGIASAEDMRFSEQKVEQSRNFCTKLWNAARFMQMQDVSVPLEARLPEFSHPVNQWIVSELKKLVTQVDEHLAKYEFNQLAQVLYHFTWGIWCDWYLELSKPLLNDQNNALAEETRAMMGWGFGVLLKTLHPVIPFITEELWQALSQQSDRQLITSRWPDSEGWPENKQIEKDMSWFLAVVSALRQVRAETRVPPKAQVELVVRDAGEGVLQKLAEYQPFLEALAGISSVSARQEPPREEEATAVVDGTEYILPLTGVIDFAAEKERIRKEIDKATQELSKVSALLDNDQFISRAASSVVEQNKMRRTQLKENISKLRQIIG
jgi:valyl-tRNA synthetase